MWKNRRTPLKRHQSELQLNFLPARYFLCGIERHGKARDNKVREGEADKEVIVNSSQFSVEDNTEDDKKVGEYGNNDNEDENQGFEGMQHTKIVLFFI